LTTSVCEMCAKTYKNPTSDQLFLGIYASGYCKKCSKGFYEECDKFLGENN
tara:strand:- start:237 stop:389 length:153 start_codon:yes stop_codon:yes gene_type:complete